MERNDNVTNLAILHPDIINIIIRIDEESMDSMRMISKVWNNLVMKFLNTRENGLPVLEFFVKKFDFDMFFVRAWVRIWTKDASKLIKTLPGWKQVVDKDKNKLLFTCFFSDLNSDPLANFLDSKPKRRREFLLGNQVSFDYLETSFRKGLKLNDIITEDKTIDKSVHKTLSSLRQFLLKCSSIETLTFSYLNAHEMQIIAKTLRNIPVDHMRVEEKILEEQMRNSILNIVRFLNTQQLTLFAQFCTKRNLREFLLKISNHLLSFRIHNCADHNFYGLPRSFWETISRQMMGNGLHHFQFCDELERQRPDDSLPEATVKERMNISF